MSRVSNYVTKEREARRRATEQAARAAARSLELAQSHAPKAKRTHLPRCNAKKIAGGRCRSRVAVDDTGRVRKRCKFHGGLSTGPRTPEGKAAALKILAEGRKKRWPARDASNDNDNGTGDHSTEAQERAR